MKIKALVSVFLLIIIVFSIFSTCYADIKPQDFDPAKNPISNQDYGKAFGKTTKIVSAITSIGIVISVIAVMVLGIRYMFGSIEQRAEYKKTMLPMFIGAILLFSISTIVSIIYSIMESVNK